VNVPSPSWIEKKFLAPELQTDDCFATGVTRQTLLKVIRKMCNFNVDFSKIFWGLCPQTPILGRGTVREGLRCPSPDATPSALRRFAPPRLARDLWSLHRRVPLTTRKSRYR